MSPADLGPDGRRPCEPGNEAAIFAGRAGRDADHERRLRRRARPRGRGPPSRKLITDKEKRVIAYHEAGHALVARLMGDAMQLHKVTIVPRGHALGYTLNLPEEDRYLQSTEELRDWLKVILAGRAAEQVVFGRITNGAANDLDRATQIARAMVFEWGMGASVRAPPGARRRLRALGGDEAPARRRAARDHRRRLPRRARARRAVPRRTSTGWRRRLLAHETLERPEIDRLLEGLSPSRTRRSTSASSSPRPGPTATAAWRLG